MPHDLMKHSKEEYNMKNELISRRRTNIKSDALRGYPNN